MDTREQLLDLLAAIGEHADLPMPDIGDADVRAHSRLASDRAHRIATAVRLVIDGGHHAAGTAEWLREEAAATPATYTPWTQQGGGDCG